MKILIMSTIIGVLILFALDIKITLRPFSIHFENWISTIGVILIAMGIGFIEYSTEKKTRRETIDQVMEIIQEKTQTEEQP